jgi:hypothetical protein
MLGALDWANLTVAGAFIAGAALATLATIRVMRAVISAFEGTKQRRRLQIPKRKDQPRD